MSGRADLPLHGASSPALGPHGAARRPHLPGDRGTVTGAMNCCDVCSPATNRVRKSAATSVIRKPSY